MPIPQNIQNMFGAQMQQAQAQAISPERQKWAMILAALGDAAGGIMGRPGANNMMAVSHMAEQRNQGIKDVENRQRLMEVLSGSLDEKSLGLLASGAPYSDVIKFNEFNQKAKENEAATAARAAAINALPENLRGVAGALTPALQDKFLGDYAASKLPIREQPGGLGGLKQYVVDGKITLMTGQEAQAARDAGKDIREYERPRAGDSPAVVPPTLDMTPDPESESITKNAGIDLNTFYALTGQTTRIPRDAASKNAAAKNAKEWADKHGVDISTLGSQYEAITGVLKNNLVRANQSKIMEDELLGTLENMKQVAGKGNLRLANVIALRSGREVNDPVAQEYAAYLEQLQNEFAAYNAALQGRSGGSILESDMKAARDVITNGLSAQGVGGLEKAVRNSTEKMRGVMDRNVDIARKAVWDLFGLGKNYKSKLKQAAPAAPQAAPQTSSGFKYIGVEP